jgi:hypothetical protein
MMKFRTVRTERENIRNADPSSYDQRRRPMSVKSNRMVKANSSWHQQKPHGYAQTSLRKAFQAHYFPEVYAVN